MLKKRFMTPDTPAATQRPVVSISLEEEALLAVETTQDIAEMNEVEKDIVATIDTIAVLDDLAETMNKIEEPTAANADLATLVSEAAVAGTDMEPEQLMPALESLDQSHWRVSVEGIKEKAARLWEWIKAQVKKFRDFLISVWRKTFERTFSVEERAKHLVEEIQNGLKTDPEEATKMFANFSYLLETTGEAYHADHMPVKNQGELLAKAIHLGDYAKYAMAMMDKTDQSWKPVVDVIIRALHTIAKVGEGQGNWDDQLFGVAEEQLRLVNAEVFKALNDNNNSMAHAVKGMKWTEEPISKAISGAYGPKLTALESSESLLGNKSFHRLWLRDMPVVTSETTMARQTTTTADMLMTSSFRFSSTDAFKQSGKDRQTIDLRFSSGNEFVQFVEGMTRIAGANHAMSQRDLNTHAIDELLKEGDAFEKALEALERKHGAISTHTRNIINVLLHYIPAVTRWSKGPWLDFMNHYLTMVSTYIVMCQKVWKAAKSGKTAE